MKLIKSSKYAFATALLGLALSSSVYAAGTITGKVSGFEVKETGYVLITLDREHANPDQCLKNKHAALPVDHAHYNVIVASLLTGKTTDSFFSIYVNGCYSNYGTSYPIVRTLQIY